MGEEGEAERLRKEVTIKDIYRKNIYVEKKKKVYTKRRGQNILREKKKKYLPRNIFKIEVLGSVKGKTEISCHELGQV